MPKVTKKNTPFPATSMDQLLQSVSFQPPKKGLETDAKIVSISKKGVLFDLGWKSYAVLGELEVQELGPFSAHLHVGDEVKVRVVVEESKEGYPVVSMKRFFDKGRWDLLEEKFKNEGEIEVMCGDYGKGGVFIDFMGIRGVIPKIQLTQEYIDSPQKLKGQKLKTKVLEVDRQKNRLVVSQKAAVLGISYKSIKEKFDKIVIGKKYKAKIIGFSEFGVFCEVDKIEGLIHISEISWAKVIDSSKYLEVGSTIDVVVVEKNEDNLKLNLSIKRLTPDPWEELEKKYPKEKAITGEIIRKERYGYIVRLEPGIEGLIHISKVEGNDTIVVGQTVSVYIENIDAKNRRISLVLVPLEKPVAYR
ncbi:hypothetical protein A2690_04825 [Candidatus Roizmanbacteria bacterium RIFCSPHIGHO2_01_FULL_39_12b]|uniref:S1 motif domain-containing protein n=1 Tax=Candidatus Roizmanbacteria bacterium RIFCSPHIGHO2_01_FULL_39_12b TaxID=1802030 RepID=A0A1F7GDW3_9BACT|nr:MAG: hypothetical protein A2690_04825 [Candidatus Roizmanbacteria bacterium RIFCSPHIGHO2_01_FULL_39_12b]OGK46055.1 MAG: hypothetical protein A3B46_00865 [Candidatus Roizmanbacteria bacterium RIFCSPLOWO2_01_FULL_39_19]